MSIKKMYKKVLAAVLIFVLLIPVANELDLISIHSQKLIASEVAGSAIPREGTVFESIVLNPGSSEREINLTWYTNSDEAGTVEFAELVRETDLLEFPDDVLLSAASTTKLADQSEGQIGYYSNKASIKGLEPNKTYVYRVGNGGEYSEINTYEIKGKYNDWSFYYGSDPQVNNGTTNIESNTSVKQWKTTVEKITEFNPDASLLVTGGDLADRGSTNAHDLQYRQGLLSVKELRSLAFAATVGNHDQWGTGSVYSDHFNNPNQSEVGYFWETPGNYWYTYHNALFIHLNMSSYNETDTSLAMIDQHIAYIKETIESNPQADWHIVVFHESIFSGGADHSHRPEIASVRNAFAPKLSEVDKTHGIDLVLGGHDHCYSRSYLMNGTNPLKDEVGPEDLSVTDPVGMTYITANTSSGIKYYDIYDPVWPYLVTINQEKTPNISNIEISGDAHQTSLHIATYRNTVDLSYSAGYEDMSVVDEFTIIKNLENKKWGSEKKIFDDETKLSVTVPNIFSQEAAEFDSAEITEGSDYQKLEAALRQDSRLKNATDVHSTYYDASLTLDEQDLKTKGIQVSVPVPEVEDGYEIETDMDGNQLYSIYHIDEYGMPYRVSNAKIETINRRRCYTFETDIVGPVAIGLAVNKGQTTSISMTNAPASTMEIGENLRINAVIEPPTSKLVYETSNSDVAKVSSDGIITAIGTGTAVITIKGERGIVSKTITITVVLAAAKSISMTNSTKATLNVGKTLEVKATAQPVNAPLTYASSNTAVASVSAEGVITAAGKGTAVITIKGIRGTASKQITVTVKQPVTELKPKTKTLTLRAGKSKKISITVLPSDANTKKLSYKSNKKSVAKVSKTGKVTAVKKGTAKITVKATDGSNKKTTVKVTVKK